MTIVLSIIAARPWWRGGCAPSIYCMREPLDILLRERLRRAIQDRIAALLGAAGLDPAAVGCTIHGERASLEVHLELPEPVGRRVEHALAVRVLDAVRSSGRTYGHIDVSVSPNDAPSDVAPVTSS